MNTSEDTIVAIATPPGVGGVGIVRVSGPDARAIGKTIASRLPEPRQAALVRFTGADGTVIDHGLMLRFDSPNSFTGEDVVELHAHGGPIILANLLQRCSELGARQARAGEFSERAFLNDKIDLLQAEAIADLIEATTERAAAAARRSLDGRFSEAVSDLTASMINLRTFVEAAIDFPDEEVDFLSDAGLEQKLDRLLDQLDELGRSVQVGRILKDGFQVVIAGPPNAGKSTLLNALSGYDAAIVTSVPGTTRDTLREFVQYQGVPFHITDTAGLRETEDPIEAEGVARARRAMLDADHLLVLQDDDTPQLESDAAFEDLPQDVAKTRVHNKIDLSGEPARIEKDASVTNLFVSAQTGAGLDLLWGHLVEVSAVATESTDGVFSARARHVACLNRVREHVLAGRHQWVTAGAGELLAEELRQAQRNLGELTGEFTNDDLLGEIFSSFCIGK